MFARISHGTAGAQGLPVPPNVSQARASAGRHKRRSSLNGLSAAALPAFLGALPISDEVGTLLRNAGEEFEFQAALHVPFLQAESCMSEFHVKRPVMQLAPAIQIESAPAEASSHTPAASFLSSFPSLRINGPMPQLSPARAHDLGACLATPQEAESPTTLMQRSTRAAQNRAASGAATMMADRAAHRLAGMHDSLTIADRYNEWVRRIRRRKRLESLAMLLSLFTAPSRVQAKDSPAAAAAASATAPAHLWPTGMAVSPDATQHSGPCPLDPAAGTPGTATSHVALCPMVPSEADAGWADSRPQSRDSLRRSHSSGASHGIAVGEAAAVCVDAGPAAPSAQVLEPSAAVWTQLVAQWGSLLTDSRTSLASLNSLSSLGSLSSVDSAELLAAIQRAVEHQPNVMPPRPPGPLSPSQAASADLTVTLAAPGQAGVAGDKAVGVGSFMAVAEPWALQSHTAAGDAEDADDSMALPSHVTPPRALRLAESLPGALPQRYRQVASALLAALPAGLPPLHAPLTSTAPSACAVEGSPMPACQAMSPAEEAAALQAVAHHRPGQRLRRVSSHMQGFNKQDQAIQRAPTCDEPRGSARSWAAQPPSAWSTGVIQMRMWLWQLLAAPGCD